MTSGNSVYRDLKSKASDIESRYKALDVQLTDIEDNIHKFTNERENCYTRISEMYLPELTSEALKNTLKEKQSRVQAIFKEKQAKRQELNNNIEDVIRERNYMKIDLDETTKELDGVSRKRDELQSIITKELSENPEYTSLAKEAGELSALVQLNKDRLTEVQSNYASKLKDYDSDIIFAYLNNKKFGTNEYHTSALIKKMDKWVAELTGFSENKKNYDFLKTMPELMSIELEQRDEYLKSLTEKGKAIEESYVSKHGLDKVMTKGNALGKKRDELMGKITVENVRHQEYLSELKQLENTKGEYHQRAIKELKNFFKSDDIADLKERARKTPSPDDDREVYKIESIDDNVRKLKNAAKDVISKKNDISSKLTEFNKLVDKFNKKDYESSRSKFKRGLDLDSLFDKYMKGDHDIDYVWDEIKKKQEWEEETSSYSSSSYSSSSSRRSSSSSSSSSWGGGFSSGGGFGGGGHSSGGGFGGGGFSSGKGF